MGRKRIYKDIDLPKETVRCVRGQISEVERERREKRQLAQTLVPVQEAMLKAGDNLGERCKRALISDITQGIGYYKSPISLYLDEKTYYRYKKKFIFDIALILGYKVT